MTDRELLELAAKAAGVDYIPAEHEKSKEAELRFGLWLKFPDNYEVPDDIRRRWNPLTNDGDALRLAVACCLRVEMGKCWNRNGTMFGEDILQGEMQATRRAIVRAAAEIGKAMT